jgi:hypothetical protein
MVESAASTQRMCPHLRCGHSTVCFTLFHHCAQCMHGAILPLMAAVRRMHDAHPHAWAYPFRSEQYDPDDQAGSC